MIFSLLKSSFVCIQICESQQSLSLKIPIFEVSIVAISISKQNSSLPMKFVLLKLSLILNFASFQDTFFAKTILILPVKDMICTQLFARPMKLTFLEMSRIVLTLIFDDDAKAVRKVILEITEIGVSVGVKFPVLAFLITFVHNALENRMIRVFDLVSDGYVGLIVFSQFFYLLQEKSVQQFQSIVLSHMFLPPTLCLPHEMENIYSCNKAISIGISPKYYNSLKKIMSRFIQIMNLQNKQMKFYIIQRNISYINHFHKAGLNLRLKWVPINQIGLSKFQ